MLLRGIISEEGLVEYLNEHFDEAKLCGFANNVPHRTTLGRFRKKFGPEFIENIHSKLVYMQTEKVTHILVDSTSLEKKKDLKQKADILPQKDFLRDLRRISFLMPI